MASNDPEHREEEETVVGKDEDRGAQVAPIVRLEAVAVTTVNRSLCCVLMLGLIRPRSLNQLGFLKDLNSLPRTKIFLKKHVKNVILLKLTTISTMLLSVDLDSVISQGMMSLSHKQTLITEVLDQSYEISLGGGDFGCCLVMLMILDSPLNKVGRLRALYVRTEKGVLFEVKPHVRIPRTYKRFSSIILQLLQKLSIFAVGRREILLRVIKNLVSQYLPINSHKIDHLSFLPLEERNSIC